jgi:hypothetical protein
LESKGIDIILGMDWLSKHKVLIECAMKSIKLTTPNEKELEFVVDPVVTAKGVANHAKVNCHTPFRDSENEASIRVPRMFHSHV